METKYVVVIMGAQGYVDVPAAVTDVPFGILQTTAAAIGDAVVVRPISSGKRSLVTISPASSVAIGDCLAINVTDATDGFADVAAKTYYPIGQALSAATAKGDEVAVQLAGVQPLCPRAS
jgi:hypothetical protein